MHKIMGLRNGTLMFNSMMAGSAVGSKHATRPYKTSMVGKLGSCAGFQLADAAAATVRATLRLVPL